MCGDTNIALEALDVKPQHEIDALKKSVGCAACRDGFFEQIREHPKIEGLHYRDCVRREDPTPKDGQLCGWSSVWEYDPDFDETYLNHDGSLVCSRCADVIPGCGWCSSGSACLECSDVPGVFPVDTLQSYDE